MYRIIDKTFFFEISFPSCTVLELLFPKWQNEQRGISKRYWQNQNNETGINKNENNKSGDISEDGKIERDEEERVRRESWVVVKLASRSCFFQDSSARSSSPVSRHSRLRSLRRRVPGTRVAHRLSAGVRMVNPR